MCIGIPMRVIEAGLARAHCTTRDNARQEFVDTSLVGSLEPGNWVMVFLGTAREIISEEAAWQAADALQAVEMAMRGETDFDHLFADLVNREPQLPEFLQPSEAAKKT
ncbi:MAG: HypC/HybG/HupF family hydrogenase formation chaperone [Alphaproteobacteria bacterium]|jgi:hydrogenase expression/formation protein HypC